jgi:hypothetical protein
MAMNADQEPQNSTTAYAREWSRIIRNNASMVGVRSIIAAINDETAECRAKHADVIVACAQLLGQSIGGSQTDIAKEMRLGIMEMIDGFAMQMASLEMNDRTDRSQTTILEWFNTLGTKRGAKAAKMSVPGFNKAVKRAQENLRGQTE